MKKSISLLIVTLLFVCSLSVPVLAQEKANNETNFDLYIDYWTVKAAIADDAIPDDLHRPGHIFPLRAKPGGVLERPGHTEATVDLMRLAGLKPYGVSAWFLSEYFA